MKIIDPLPLKVSFIEHCWIPMPDGCRLAARMWLPENAESRPVPAILEYIPYRKRDGTRWRDEPMHHYFAGHGYAAIRIDVRGSGDSEGILTDEYSEQELDDGLAAIRWIAAQPWCSGAVGMMGKSWGGFNALQIAARRPPALKAVITACASDDRYRDDAHYMGGCLLNENLIWGSVLFTLVARPPDPEVVGGRWREMWQQRLENLFPFVENWLQHPRRDEYWQRGSVCQDFSQIDCPVYALGGWADAYVNAVPRLMAGLTVPRKGLIGPWAHLYPHNGVPGPAIGFLQEALRWWDHWLKNIDTGIMREPTLRLWMQEGVPPQSFYPVRPGRWIAENSWPSRHIITRKYYFRPGQLVERDLSSSTPGKPITISSPLSTGTAAGSWCNFGVAGEMPSDQQTDDGKSLIFDSAPVGESLEMLGGPLVTLKLSADRPQGLVAVRLNDVAVNGSVTRVTYGLLNLTHHISHEKPQPLRPGKHYTVAIKLNDSAYTFRAGHRLRIAVSTNYWPLVWPSPAPVTLSIFPESSALEIPVRPPQPGDDNLPGFQPPEGAASYETEDEYHGEFKRWIQNDPLTGETIYTSTMGLDKHGRMIFSSIEPIDLQTAHSIFEQFKITGNDPLSARGEIRHTVVSKRNKWHIRIETRTRLSCTQNKFLLKVDLHGFEGETLFFSKHWDRRIPRE